MWAKLKNNCHSSVAAFMLVLFLIGCNSKHKLRKKDESNNEVKQSSVSGYADTQGSRIEKPEALYAEFGDKSTKIVVLNAMKYTDSTLPHYALDEQKCKNWVLSKIDIINILLLSKEIDLREWHTDYSFLPCSYRGELLINGKIAKFSINAGAYSSISFGDSVLNLGYKEKDYKRFFLEGRFSPPEYNE